MNVADSPEMAVRFGSASVRITPALSIARIVACTDGVEPNDVVRLLLVIGPPWTDSEPPIDVLYIRDILSGQANEAGATFIDPISDGWFVGRPDLIGPDGVHPNDAGHAYMAEKIAPLIHAQLSRRG